MRWCLLSVLVFLYVFNPINARALSEQEDDDDSDEGYYWKDYTGKIPKDALPGGINSHGKTTYIGQALHREQLIPAKIDPESNKVYFEWGYKEHEATENIKILCTRYPEQFEWISSGNGILQNLEKDKHLVKGGYEANTKMFIGRKQLDNELALGKVISTKIQTTLNTTKDGIGTQHATFDVLTYNPNIKTTKWRKSGTNGSERPITFDVRGGAVANETKVECKGKIVVNFFS